MAEKVIEIGLAPVEEYYYRRSRCTTIWAICWVKLIWSVVIMGWMTIVDFKQSNRPKRKEWIEDYYLQITIICHGS